MPSWILFEHLPSVWNCLISWFVLSECLLAYAFWFRFHRCILVGLLYYSLLHSPDNASGLFSGLSVLFLCSGCSCQITKCAPVMNTGMRFFRYSILLPNAFFLSNLELLTRLTSKLALPFSTVVWINALGYTKRDVFLSIHATLFLKSCIELSSLLSYNPLEMAVDIMQPDCEGLGLWALWVCAGTVDRQSHCTSLPVLEARHRHLLSPPGASQSPGQKLWLTSCAPWSLAGGQHHSICIPGMNRLLTSFQLILMSLAKSANL